MWKDILKISQADIDYVSQFLNDLKQLKDKHKESFIVGHTNNNADIAYMRLERAAMKFYTNLSVRGYAESRYVNDLNEELEEVLKGNDGRAFSKEFKRELVALVENLEKQIHVKFKILRDRGSLDLYL